MTSHNEDISSVYKIKDIDTNQWQIDDKQGANAKLRIDNTKSVDTTRQIDHTKSVNTKRKTDSMENFNTKKIKYNNNIDMKELVLPQSNNSSQFCYRHNPIHHQNKSAYHDCIKTKSNEIDIIHHKITEELSSNIDDNQKKTIEDFVKIFIKSKDSEIHSKHFNESNENINHNNIDSFDKNQILSIVLNSLCSPQLSHIAETCQDLIKLDFLTSLPREISIQILQYLDCQSLCMASQVSKQWQKLADDDTVWYFMCLQHIDKKCEKCGWGLPLLQMKNRRYISQNNYSNFSNQNSNNSMNSRRDLLRDINVIPILADFQNQSNTNQDDENEENINDMKSGINNEDNSSVNNRNNNNRLPPPLKDLKNSAVQMRPWKTVYKERFNIEKNWRRGIFKSFNFRAHLDSILSVKIQFGLLFTGSYDNTLAIWKIPSLSTDYYNSNKKNTNEYYKQLMQPQLLRRLTGHQDAIKTITFNSTTLITGSLDKTIKIWNFQTGQCISTYRGHTDAVLSIDSCGSYIASGSADKTVRVWHIDSRTCYTLKGHTDWVNCVKLDYESRTCFSCSDDFGIKMWDINENKLIKNFKGHLGQVQKIVLLHLQDDVNLVTDDNCIDQNNNRIDSNNVESGLKKGVKYPTHVVSCSLDSTIKIWDVKTGKCIRTQFGHVGGVWDIECDNFRIISCSRDKHTKVWDLQNGKLLLNFNESDNNTEDLNSNISNGNNGNCGAIKNCLDLGDSEFITGDDSGFIKIYNFNV